MFLRYSCRRYRKLRDLSSWESLGERSTKFLATHIADCPACRRWEGDEERLSRILRLAKRDYEGRPGFTEATVKAVHNDRLRRRSATWRPVALGAVTAAFAVAAALQLVTNSANQLASPTGEAKRHELRGLPDSVMPGTFKLFDTPSQAAPDPEPFDV